ncbi:MAG: AcvB/VirJ family lysyl-phosphatidylglycerol hydrolase, partial [Pseudoxanthomonas sp.]
RRTALLAAAAALAAHPLVHAVPPPPADLAGLPLIEVPAAAGSHGDTYAVLLSGDGGWAGLDKEVAGALAARGVPVVGFDSLRYFWKPRTPAELAADLDRLVRYYDKRWGKSRVVLVGYSQGADVLPFAINRLAPDTRAAVAQSVLLGLSDNAAFEFHLSNWMSDEVADGRPTLPEILRLRADQVVCVAGDGDDDSVCAKVPAGHMRSVVLPGGHHFDGDYAAVARAVLAVLPAAAH